MTKKIPAIAAAVVLGALATPSTSHAQTSDKDAAKIKRFFKKLKKLPNAQNRPAPVNSLAKKLVKLDPKGAKKYYKTATVKYLAAFVEKKATQLQKIYTRLLQKAADKGEISAALAKRLVKVTQKIEERIIQKNDPTPTPTPYQASSGEVGPVFA